MGADKNFKIIRFISITAVIVGSLVLLGWKLDVNWLKSIFPGYATMKANTAACFVLSGASLLFLSYAQTKRNETYSKIFSILLLGIALGTLCEYLFARDLHIDDILFTNKGAIGLGDAAPNRMSIASALCFSLIGFALIGMLSKKYTFGLTAQYALHLTSIISFIAIMGYVFSVPAFYKFSFIIAMALHTSVLMFLLSLAASTYNSSIGLTQLFTGKAIGNIMARRLFPLLCVLVLILAYLRIQTHRLGMVNVELGIAMFALSFIFVGLFIVWDTAKMLNRIDRKRSKAENELQKLNESLQQNVIDRTAELKELSRKFILATTADAGSMITYGQLFDLISDQISIALLYWDKDLICRYANKAFVDFFGLVRDDVVNKMTMKEFQGSAYDKNYHYVAGALKGVPQSFEREVIPADGRGASFLLVSYYPDIVNSEVRGFFVHGVDISHIKQLESELKESKEIFANSFNNAGTCKALLAPGGMWIMVNDKICELTGYPREEFLNLHYNDITYPEDIGLDADLIAQLVKNEIPAYTIEKRYLSKTGAVIDTLLTVSLVRDNAGNPKYFICDLFDITYKKQIEEELRISQELFSNSFNFSTIGKGIVSPDRKWISVNDAFCHFTGYPREELMGMHFNDITHPDDLNIGIEFTQQLIQGSIPSFSVEKRYITKDRRIIDVLVSSTLIRDSKGNPKYFISDYNDITHTKELNKEIVRKNVELELSAENLVNKINQLDELNHVISHNLRGPIGNIKLLSEDSGIFDEKESMKLINDSSNSLLDQLNVLLDLSEIKLNKNIAYEECNLVEIINKIIAQLQAVIYKNNIKIDLAINVENVSCPRIYIESILYNLVSNAIKYRKIDGIPTIEIGTKKVNDKIQLSVKDNGIGLDLERYGDKIFKLNQIFHQGYDSKGVGLFITKTQIESIGGTIEVRSKVDEGTEFIVTF